MTGKTSKGLVIASCLATSLLSVALYSAATGDMLVVGTIPNSQVFDGPVTVAVRALTLKPGEELPWHYHSGYAFNVVKSGTLTVEDGCAGEKTLTAGQGFEETDSRVHRGKNLSDKETVVYDTFFIRQGKPITVTIPGNQPRCGPPNEAEECRNDGWRRITHPQRLTNEAQCLNLVRDMRGTLARFQKTR
jgi:quercetin dioxygenase-like cupin family protein